MKFCYITVVLNLPSKPVLVISCTLVLLNEA